MPHPSLFLKLTALALVAAIATGGVFTLAGKTLFQTAREHHAHHIGHMARLVIRAVLHEPTPQALTRIGEDLGIQIRYTDAAGTFATDEAMPAFAQLTPLRKRRGWRKWHMPRQFALARAKDEDELYLLYDNGTQRAVIALEDDTTWSHLPWLAAATLAALLLIWGGVYLLIRRQLAPLAALRAEMEAVGSGAWRECAVVRNDEIGLLAQGFNTMQQRLKNLLAARERFLLAASHELRSPIARLKLAAEMVRDPRAKDSITRDVAELETLTAQLLDNARLRSAHAPLHRQPLPLRTWLGEVLAARPATERARLTLTAGSDPIAHIDAALLARTINNLLDNALKYAGSAQISVQTATTHLAIQVCDDGSGVSEEALPLLFEPFFRADESRTRSSGGFGLGLALAAACAEAHGGSLHAANRQPHGLMLTLRLPAAVGSGQAQRHS